MSCYATAANFNVYGIRSAALPSSITDADKLAAVTAASGRADSYLGSKFRLPLSAWGDDLRQAVCAIAAFELVASQVGFNPDAGHNIVLVDRKADAIKWLEQVAAGKVAPSGLADSTPPAGGVSKIYSNPRRGW